MTLAFKLKICSPLRKSKGSRGGGSPDLILSALQTQKVECICRQPSVQLTCVQVITQGLPLTSESETENGYLLKRANL